MKIAKNEKIITNKTESINRCTNNIKNILVAINQVGQNIETYVNGIKIAI